MRVASWKINLYQADPQKVADEIAGIGDAATAEAILERARDPETELHRCFEWDDTLAAEKYRLFQARQIVCNLVFKEAEKPDQTPRRVFYATNSGGGYKPTEIIMRNEDEYQKLLRRACSELSAFQRKYQMLTELECVFEEIEKLAG